MKARVLSLLGALFAPLIRVSLGAAALFCYGAVFLSAQTQSHQSAYSELPHLKQTGSTMQMIVDGKPYLMLAGELHNSSASSSSYMQPLWEKLKGLNLNTVIGTVSWELIEPVEGQFDFASVDSEIQAARDHGFHLVLIWFGTWKNASSSYVPLWVKRDPERFPPARSKEGKDSFMGLPIESLSSLGEATIGADARAFRALMRHIREIDGQHTVIMMQVENETGLLGDSRDRSTLAEAAWSKPVPRELLSYLVQHKEALLPELSRVWAAHGFRTSGSWAEVFGTDSAADEIFMAWHIGRAVNVVAEAGKSELALPMYANSWLGPQPGQQTPGQYPSGGPVAGMLDVWRAAAPKLDLFAPDIYVADFTGVCALQVRSGNPLFIPEARADIPNLFWAVGHHSALGYSPFGIEDLADFKSLASAYSILGGLAPLILKSETEGGVMTVLEGNEESVKQFEDATGLTIKFGGLRALLSPGSQSETKSKDLPPAPIFDSNDGEFTVKAESDKRGFALVLRTAPNQIIVAGSNVLIASGRSHLGSIDEGHMEGETWVQGRRLNGDESLSDNFVTMGSSAIVLRKIETYSVNSSEKK